MLKLKAENRPTNGHISQGAGPIRVVIVENHQLVSDSLAELLGSLGDMEVVGQASSVAEASAMSAEVAPTLVVMDFHLRDGTGHDAAIAMRRIFPDVRFVFLSRDESDEARLAAVEAGASAYLSKGQPAAEVIEAIRQVARGASLISPATVARLVTAGRDREHVRDSLSAREREVLQLFATGLPTRQVAKELGISYSTVRTHIHSISNKLGVHSVVNAVVTARELELVS